LLFPDLDLSPLPGKPRGKLRLSPEDLLEVLHAQELATWALQTARSYQPPHLPQAPGGRPPTYADDSIVLLAVVQTVWRCSYETIIDELAQRASLAHALGFGEYTISQGQYWERRRRLGVLVFLLFFVALVAQWIRLGVITGTHLIVDASLLPAWRKADPDAHWQHYKGKSAVFGYKVHTVLCGQSDLPIFVLLTPVHINESLVGWFILLVAALLFGLSVEVVYADAGYFNGRMLNVIHDILGAHPAVNYNPRGAGKRQIATLFFVWQWRRLVMGPRTAIECHFAWMKRYFGLKGFQQYTLVRMMQFVLLTYIACLAIALAATRYQRPELIRSRSKVIAHL
jgi:hypothetical protein